MQYYPKHRIQPDLKEVKASPHAPQHQQWLVSAEHKNKQLVLVYCNTLLFVNQFETKF
jgi:hypothetical protein